MSQGLLLANVRRYFAEFLKDFSIITLVCSTYPLVSDLVQCCGPTGGTHDLGFSCQRTLSQREQDRTHRFNLSGSSKGLMGGFATPKPAIKKIAQETLGFRCFHITWKLSLLIFALSLLIHNMIALTRQNKWYKTFCYRAYAPQVSVDLFSLHNLSGYLYII